jgi:hypothetical protein
MGARLHRLEALVEEGAAVLHVGHPAAVAKAALAAEVFGGVDAALAQWTGAVMRQ